MAKVIGRVLLPTILNGMKPLCMHPACIIAASRLAVCSLQESLPTTHPTSCEADVFTQDRLIQGTTTPLLNHS